MRIDLNNINGISIAEVISEGVIIHETQDALDLMADCGYRGARSIIIRERNIIPDFFDLKTGIAGDILQKFSNYDVRLAIVGDFSRYTSKSLRDFVRESNRVGRINFVGSLQEAKDKLTVRFRT
jgi:uncharacterized membrane protein